jgi:UDPglucose--hexose-1-phosphate uridylyltransferase
MRGLSRNEWKLTMNDSGENTREIRINPIVPTESVLVATARGMRPKEAEERVERDTRAVVDTCPFCRGNEHRTPPPIRSYPDSGDWDIRIVPNLYPVLGDDRAQPNIAFGLQQVIDGYGRHEVVIDNPNHGIALHEVVERGEHFVAIKPFASRFEWEIHILPLKQQADFLKATARS